MTGWEWEGAAKDSAGCGVSDNETRARQAAEAWLKANPQGTVVLGPMPLAVYRVKGGCAERSRRLQDGRIVWARIPAPQPGACG